MLIELHGADFINKGGQLMLETVIQRVKSRFPGAAFCLEREPRHSAVELRRHAIKTIFFPAPRRRPRRQLIHLPLSDLAGRVAPTFLLKRGEEVARHSVEALFDVSGYAFGDAWGPGMPIAFAKRARYYRRRGKPVVMMPQMFGPFGTTQTQRAMRDICDTANLVYARDQISYQCVRNLLGRDYPNLQVAPDITIFAEPDANTPIPEGPYACIVPNVRLLDEGRIGWQDHYAEDLVRAIRLLTKHGLRVMVVVHETLGYDLQLARRIIGEAGLSDDSLFESNSPLQLKAILGGAYLAIASRFHAAIGTLSSGVPTIVLGWAHKYEMMVRDFQTPEYLYNATDNWDRLESMLLDLLREATHTDVVARLRTSKQQMKPANDRMWSDTFALLEKVA